MADRINRSLQIAIQIRAEIGAEAYENTLRRSHTRMMPISEVTRQ